MAAKERMTAKSRRIQKRFHSNAKVRIERVFDPSQLTLLKTQSETSSQLPYPSNYRSSPLLSEIDLLHYSYTHLHPHTHTNTQPAMQNVFGFVLVIRMFVMAMVIFSPEDFHHFHASSRHSRRNQFPSRQSSYLFYVSVCVCVHVFVQE